MVDMASVEMSDAFLEGSSQAPEAHWVLTVIPFKSAVEVVQALQEEDMDSVAIIDERFPYRLVCSYRLLTFTRCASFILSQWSGFIDLVCLHSFYTGH